MFIQVIRGKAKDPAALEQRLGSWESDVKPGATGFEGALTGLTQHGEWFTMVRFDNEANARANSDRPEQGAWWEETAAHYDGEPTFVEGEDTEVVLGGAAPDAEFVQVMVGRAHDRETQAQIEEELTPLLAEVHPGFKGSVRLWNGNDFIDAIYFSNEAEARSGEKAMNEHPEFQPLMEKMMGLSEGIDFLDITAPIHIEA
jgi:hypothetical protein